MKVIAKLATVLAVVLLLGGSAVVDAAAKPAKGDKAAKKADRRGEVVKVDGTKLVISKDAKETTIETNEKTVVIVEDKEVKIADLKPGQKVRVSPETGVAEKIEVRAKKDAK
jgi:ferric-dicitrate binding protein FerR (iron transport regulator)